MSIGCDVNGKEGWKGPVSGNPAVTSPAITSGFSAGRFHCGMQWTEPQHGGKAPKCPQFGIYYDLFSNYYELFGNYCKLFKNYYSLFSKCC